MALPKSLSVTRRFKDDARGNVTIITAAFMSITMGAAALAIDLGSVYLQRRTTQGIVDLAAMAASADLDHAEAAARATLAANNVTNIQSLNLTLGQYRPDPAVSAGRRFVANVAPYNAVKVDLRTAATLYFSRVFVKSPMIIGVNAIGASSAEATFSIGSRLAALNGGIVNAMLGGLLGSNISLSVMDYNALLKANVQLLDFMSALATRLNITAGTYQDVFDAGATVGDVLTAASSVTSKNGDSVATLALQRLLASSGAGKSLKVPLNNMIDLGSLGALGVGQPKPGFSAVFRVMDLISGATSLANGQRQISVDLGATIPGIASLKLLIAIGEPMQKSAWASVGTPGSVIHTAQTRLLLVAQVLGTGLLNNVSIRLPIYLEVANADGRLASVACNTATPTANIATTPAIAEAWLGEPNTRWSDLTSRPVVSKAQLVDTSLLSISAYAHIAATNVSETVLSFTQSDVDDGTFKQVDTNNIIETVVSSLLSRTSFEIKLAGLSLLSPALLQNALADILTPLARPLDDVVNSILQALGLHLGQADVQVNGIRCRAGVLAG